LLLGTSHRQAPVRRLMGRIKETMADLFAAPEGYEVVIGNGGATCFWDMATVGLILHRSQHLVFGEFSAKFAQAVAAAPFLDSPEILRAAPGTRPEPRVSEEVDCYCLTQNETSTGVAMPVLRLGDGGQLVLVDATSAAGGMDVDLSECDAYYFSPQKCFAADGGLWVALLSPAAVERARAIADSDRWVPPFLDLWGAIESSRLDQTVNTPAIATLFLLAQQADWMQEHGGLKWAAARCRESSSLIYGWAQRSPYASPFVAREEDRSPVVATVDLDPAISAAEVSAVLRQNGIVDTESYRKLGRNQLRLGLFPAVDPADVQRLTAAIDWVVAMMSSRTG
jgi:phosphoserine aminotransferase